MADNMIQHDTMCPPSPTVLSIYLFIACIILSFLFVRYCFRVTHCFRAAHGSKFNTYAGRLSVLRL